MMQPQIVGPHGKAWLADTATGIRMTRRNPAENACLVHWVIEAVWAHPLWSSYSLLLCHLRNIPVQRPTIFYLQGATHELWLYAIDPESDRDYLIRTGLPVNCWLQPINFAAQIIADDDASARARIHDAVVLICNGQLSPDTDFRQAWVELFGDNMLLKHPLEHMWSSHEQKQ